MIHVALWIFPWPIMLFLPSFSDCLALNIYNFLNLELAVLEEMGFLGIQKSIYLFFFVALGVCVLDPFFPLFLPLRRQFSIDSTYEKL